MEEKEFYIRLLAHALTGTETSINIMLEGKAPEMMINELAERDCCIALKKIHKILTDRDNSDEECFQKIEEIVMTLGSLGIGCGDRHDFG